MERECRAQFDAIKPSDCVVFNAPIQPGTSASTTILSTSPFIPRNKISRPH